MKKVNLRMNLWGKKQKEPMKSIKNLYLVYLF